VAGRICSVPHYTQRVAYFKFFSNKSHNVYENCDVVLVSVSVGDALSSTSKNLWNCAYKDSVS